ncbi:MAG: hypothetical protein SV186_03670 [Candidatus Nanohaloarchaea archaeon]|nr:hypothetical protein [Candidatus Nanohaloarchaea archaeon]
MRKKRFGGWPDAAAAKNNIEKKFPYSLARNMDKAGTPSFEQVMEFFETMPRDLSDVEQSSPGLIAGSHGEPPAAEIQDYSELEGDEALDHYLESDVGEDVDLVQFQFDVPGLIGETDFARYQLDDYDAETEEEALHAMLDEGDLKLEVDGNHLEVHERQEDDYEQLFRDSVPYHTERMEKDGKYLVQMEGDYEVGMNNGVLTVEIPLQYTALGPEDESDKVY